MTARYVKTDAGREEIRARAHALSRPARNLLLIIDGSRSGAEWLQMVAGTGTDDLAELLRAGLIAEVAAPRAASSPVPPAAPSAAALPAADEAAELARALESLSYRQLYDRLTSEARPRLGLIKGYRMVLEIEKCSGAEEIRKLALRFVDALRAAQGDAAAREFCRSLGAPAQSG
ncbi:MAG: hypothetical protein ABT20_06945 [Rubrivivax sp. SCN 70-15]|nr:MAG: hypothetical protein ABT20_06945 [Rubrivivax sp. SCN 70-15]